MNIDPLISDLDEYLADADAALAMGSPGHNPTDIKLMHEARAAMVCLTGITSMQCDTIASLAHQLANAEDRLKFEQETSRGYAEEVGELREQLADLDNDF